MKLDTYLYLVKKIPDSSGTLRTSGGIRDGNSVGKVVNENIHSRFTLHLLKLVLVRVIYG